jgi:hypothetical protein
MAILEQRVAHSRERIKLGEAAYLLDQAACAFVFRNSRYRKGTTIGELRTRAWLGELNDEQLSRWQRFCSFTQRHGWSISDACVTSTVVKEMRLEDVHCSDDEKATTTLQQLQSCMQREAQPDERDDCLQFLQLVALFGQANKPLLLVGNVDAVVDPR